jgi:hypothetical protein
MQVKQEKISSGARLLKPKWLTIRNGCVDHFQSGSTVTQWEGYAQKMRSGIPFFRMLTCRSMNLYFGAMERELRIFFAHMCTDGHGVKTSQGSMPTRIHALGRPICGVRPWQGTAHYAGFAGFDSFDLWLARRVLAQPSLFTCCALATASESAGTSFVIQEPAPI